MRQILVVLAILAFPLAAQAEYLTLTCIQKRGSTITASTQIELDSSGRVVVDNSVLKASDFKWSANVISFSTPESVTPFSGGRPVVLWRRWKIDRITGTLSVVTQGNIVVTRMSAQCNRSSSAERKF